MSEKQAAPQQSHKHKSNKPPPTNHHKGDKAKVASAVSEKPKTVAVTEKAKSDSNGGKPAAASASSGAAAPAEAAPKPKPKKFGEDYVEAPLPTVNPWKKPTSGGVSASASFGPDLQPTQAVPVAAAVPAPRKDPYRAAVAPSFVAGMCLWGGGGGKTYCWLNIKCLRFLAVSFQVVFSLCFLLDDLMVF